jgi:glycine cleavage system H protein
MAGGERPVNVPADLRYTKSHEWIRIEGDIATIGITDHAQSELGDIVFVELPSPGRVLQIEETFGSVESVKTVSDLYAPVAGEVTETNPILGAQSELVNTDPYQGGWMVKIRMSNPSEADALLDASAYEAELS